MPKPVARWKKVLDVVSGRTKRRIEQEVLLWSRKKFGDDFHERFLLSLPPENISKGVLKLGTIVYEKEKWPIGITTRELLQNLAVFGRSGSGKTNVVFQLLSQLQSRNVPFLFLDWKRTARHLIPNLTRKTQIFTAGRSLVPLAFNPLLVPPGMDRLVYLMQVVDLLAQAFTLGDGAKNILQKAICACYEKSKTPSFSDVKSEIENMKTKERQTGWKLSAMRAIESVTFATTNVDSKSQTAFANSLMNQNTIIELDGLSQNSRKFLIPLLCSWVYAVRLASNVREVLRFVVVFEEAHHVLFRQESRSTETLMNQLLRQGRELGIGCVVVDQHPHLISSAALGNCYTTICLNQKDPTDINKAAGLSLLDESQKRHLSLLTIGQGVVKLQGRWQKPFLVKFPLVDVKKGFVTDLMVSEFARGRLTLSAAGKCAKITAAYTENCGERGGAVSRVNPHFPASVTAEKEALPLLHDILRYPSDGVAVRYKRLGISGRIGNRLKEQLISSGLVSVHRMSVGRTTRVMLSPTTYARQILASQSGDDPQASFTHEYWKRETARRFEKDGYTVAIESPRANGGGCMDILARKATESVAIEIETGKSDVACNVKRDLLCGVDKVIVVATDDKALKKVERKLGKAGLLISGRVEIVMAGAMDGNSE